MFCVCKIPKVLLKTPMYYDVLITLSEESTNKQKSVSPKKILGVNLK